MRTWRSGWNVVCAVALVAGVAASGAIPAGAEQRAPGDGRPADHWTTDRIAAAIPRDLVVDPRGLGYLRGRDGSLSPYGHAVAAERSSLRAQPTAGSPAEAGATPSAAAADTTAPSISAMDPGPGDTIGASHVFSATVTDAESGVRSVVFLITFPGGSPTQSVAATRNGDVWSASIDGFTAGAWTWTVRAMDNARNRSTSPSVAFTVDTGSSGGTVTNSEWTADGQVQTAAGRIYFEMPANRRQSRWVGYVCSGTVATDETTGRSIIITAAHCVYDDVHKAFARNVLFIPDQANTTGVGTDGECNNDPLGCWEPSFGVVDSDWATRKFPANIPWDYAYYAVPDAGAHVGTPTAGDELDVIAGSLPVQFTDPVQGALTHALGYSYSEDPKFMYCAEAMGTEGADNWWLPSCLLSGGSSGGPWVQPMDSSTGSGPIISVNSWGYTGSPGMAGPKLAGSSASCLFSAAKTTSFASVTDRGTIPVGC